jgi:hypothetical protein
MMPLKDRMRYEVPLQIPGFDGPENEQSVGPVVQFSLAPDSSAEWYRRTTQHLLDRFGKGYFPVFRFSDGECYFCLGYRMPRAELGRSRLSHYMRTFLSAYVKYRCHRNFWSGRPGYGHEMYRYRQWNELRPKFAVQLRQISECGLIAGNFCRQKMPWMLDRYVPDIFDWFDAQRIVLDSGNYMPFYFVYAMLLGPERHRFLAGRNLLVITNLGGDKEANLRRYFRQNGAASVKFISISRSNGMCDTIDLQPEHAATDLVLVGAGVGAANILSQVKPLGALSIDAGYVLDCYENSKYKGRRAFTLPDEDIGAAGGNPVAVATK